MKNSPHLLTIWSIGKTSKRYDELDELGLPSAIDILRFYLREKNAGSKLVYDIIIDYFRKHGYWKDGKTTLQERQRQINFMKKHGFKHRTDPIELELDESDYLDQIHPFFFEYSKKYKGDKNNLKFKTIPQLKGILDEAGIRYKAHSLKPELINQILEML